MNSVCCQLLSTHQSPDLLYPYWTGLKYKMRLLNLITTWNLTSRTDIGPQGVCHLFCNSNTNSVIPIVAGITLDHQSTVIRFFTNAKNIISFAFQYVFAILQRRSQACSCLSLQCFNRSWLVVKTIFGVSLCRVLIRSSALWFLELSKASLTSCTVLSPLLYPRHIQDHLLCMF